MIVSTTSLSSVVFDISYSSRPTICSRQAASNAIFIINQNLQQFLTANKFCTKGKCYSREGGCWLSVVAGGWLCGCEAGGGCNSSSGMPYTLTIEKTNSQHVGICNKKAQLMLAYPRDAKTMKKIPPFRSYNKFQSSRKSGVYSN